MPSPVEEARLEQTKMSFGEHLEELRRALFRSLAALLIGFIAGLCLGMPLVDYIQVPLRRGLEDFYARKSVAEQQEWLESRRDAGEEVPEDIGAAARQMGERRLTPHTWYVSLEELAEALGIEQPQLAAQLPDQAPGGEAPNAAPADGRPAEGQPGDGTPPQRRRTGQAADAPPGMIRLRFYQPLEDDARMRAIATSTEEPFIVYIKVSFAAGLVLASPFIFYFVWEFVAAGLYGHEKKYVHIYLPLSLGLFVSGAGIAFFYAFDYVLEFLFWFHEKMNIDPYPRLSDWVTTVVLLPLMFGISFQLPLAMLLLERVGIFSIAAYRSKWRIAIVVIAVLSMVLTPGGDVSSMLMMFIPLTGLYFFGIALCRYMPGTSLRGPDPLADGPPPEQSAGS
ncbi:MAG TPA: twin-arginine translocase subunit TatC [Lacipirellulaceae bacterium]|nr:twin-arginine translocase subunit TatC [Lacipirellulaceae bacterium]